MTNVHSCATGILEMCTKMVYCGAVKEKARRSVQDSTEVMPRASVSFPPEIYRGLEELAAKKKVSIAWVVRDAVEKYLVEEFPLFGTSLLKEAK